ncbi:MAG TPA: MFS transporter [Bradyrhizobium sp.]|jgi:ACS family D-galactonate transporter-like MFS transporter|uniref:MFS transporter n=1 Tax=Bradyrhizobium sp. TaxID=376 RepID=UPI002C021EB8|nr:MFS transporter [Bradyrhizobium sp.]HTB02271.1 MFS transporter [Bradyrhizobium sp.]
MSTQKTSKYAWVIVLLLFLFMLINFADKAVIGLAAAPIMKDLDLTPSQFGLVGSSFFFLYAVSGVVTGFVVNRVQTRWALLAMGLIWAVTQFPMAGSVGFTTLIACRVLLGAGEGPAYPVALHSAYKWFPNELRTLPTALISQGASIGVVLALPALNYLIVRYSWHWAFATLGLIGLVWALGWLAFGREGPLLETPTPADRQSYGRIPYRRLLLNRTVLAACASGFGAYWGLSLMIAWLPHYLIKGLGYTQQQTGWLSTLPWACNVLVVIGAGWLSQKLLARSYSSVVARSLIGGGAVALGGLALIVMPLIETPVLNLAFLVFGISVPSVIYVLSPAIVSEFTPVSQRGAMLTIVTAVATSAGLLAPYVMGRIIESGATPSEGFHRGFLICGVVSLIGGLIGMAFLRPGAEAARFAVADAADATIRNRLINAELAV